MPRFDGSTPGPGRPRGVPNRATAAVKAFWAEYLGSSKYLKAAAKRMGAGRAPHLYVYWLKRLYGDKSELEITGPDGRPLQLRVLFGGRYRPDGHNPDGG
jgi:hypothetical protein